MRLYLGAQCVTRFLKWTWWTMLGSTDGPHSLMLILFCRYTSWYQLWLDATGANRFALNTSNLGILLLSGANGFHRSGENKFARALCRRYIRRLVSTACTVTNLPKALCVPVVLLLFSISSVLISPNYYILKVHCTRALRRVWLCETAAPVHVCARNRCVDSTLAAGFKVNCVEAQGKRIKL